MTFSVSPSEFVQLQAELLAKHSAIVTPTSDYCGNITSVNGKLAAAYSYNSDKGELSVTLTKHEGYPGLLADMVLKDNFNTAIKAIRSATAVPAIQKF